MVIDTVSALIGFLGAIIGAFIGVLIGPWINHKYALKLMKEKWMFDWKIKNFTRINSEISKKIEVYNAVIKNLQYDKGPNKKLALEKVDNEMIYNKINDEDFFLFVNFDNESFNSMIDMNKAEMGIAINIKEYIKTNNENLLVEAALDLGNLNILKSRFLKNIKKQII